MASSSQADGAMGTDAIGPLSELFTNVADTIDSQISSSKNKDDKGQNNIDIHNATIIEASVDTGESGSDSTTSEEAKDR